MKAIAIDRSVVVVAIAVLVLWVRSRPGMRTHLDRPLLLKQT